MNLKENLKWVEINLAAIAENTRWVVSSLSDKATLMAVIKADAYGHGATQVARTVIKSGAKSLGVRDLSEASELRRAKISSPIHVLFPILPSQAKFAASLNVSLTIDQLEIAQVLNKAAGKKKIVVHVEVDSGLGRWGIAPSKLPSLMDELQRLKSVQVMGLSTHIDYVPGKNSVEAEEKLQAFRKLSSYYKRKNPKLVVHAANSSIFMDFPHHRLDVACIGNLLYGINPSSTRQAPLKNAWHFCARVLSINQVRKGVSVGYASEYITPKMMTIATLPVGYADGLTMEPAERLIGFGGGFQYWGKRNGVNFPFIGRCGFSHVLVDASHANDLSVGDVITLPVRRTAARHLPRIYLK